MGRKGVRSFAHRSVRHHPTTRGAALRRTAEGGRPHVDRAASVRDGNLFHGAGGALDEWDAGGSIFVLFFILMTSDPNCFWRTDVCAECVPKLGNNTLAVFIRHGYRLGTSSLILYSVTTRDTAQSMPSENVTGYTDCTRNRLSRIRGISCYSPKSLKPLP